MSINPVGVVEALETLRVNPDWASLPLFDRTGWSRVRFGDVVKRLKEEVNPASEQVERYVAGEHMDSGAIHIRRWGTVGDGYLGPAFIRRFRKGQVLYGSRRTYLKKVAVAEWDGVTANTTFVLEAVEGRLLQELLPWVMLSERFTQHSIRESKGSTNPYINFPDIAKFEFDLPPLDQQRRIADALIAHCGAVDAGQACREASAALKRAALTEMTGASADSKGVAFRPLGTVASFQYGLSVPLYSSGEFPVLRMMNFAEELVVHSDMKYISATPQTVATYALAAGDILFNRTNSLDLVGKTGIFFLQGTYLFASYLVRIRTDRSVLLPEFLNYYMNSGVGQTAIRGYATPGVTRTSRPPTGRTSEGPTFPASGPT